jgi:hypothetical protein
VALGDRQETLEYDIVEQVGLQAEIDQSRMSGAVVVALLLDPRVGQELDSCVAGAGRHYRLGHIHDRELLGELVEYAVLAARRRVLGSQTDAFDRVHDVDDPRVWPPEP